MENALVQDFIWMCTIEIKSVRQQDFGIRAELCDTEFTVAFLQQISSGSPSMDFFFAKQLQPFRQQNGSISQSKKSQPLSGVKAKRMLS